MESLDRLNKSVADILGQATEPGARYTEEWSDTWQLVRYSHQKLTEFSLFMMIYDTHPLFMASFIKGMTQRTSTGDDPMIATCKAFVMMFAPSEEEPYH